MLVFVLVLVVVPPLLVFDEVDVEPPPVVVPVLVEVLVVVLLQYTPVTGLYLVDEVQPRVDEIVIQGLPVYML